MSIARERKKQQNKIDGHVTLTGKGKCGGRKQHSELNPEIVKRVKNGQTKELANQETETLSRHLQYRATITMTIFSEMNHLTRDVRHVELLHVVLHYIVENVGLQAKWSKGLRIYRMEKSN